MPCAVAYYRTSSQSNVDGDSVPRQRAACVEYAERQGLTIEAEFNDAAVRGTDAVATRRGFAALMAWCGEHGCRTILVENASRFARDLIVSEVGYEWLKGQGFSLVAVDDPDAFTADTPTAKLVRQILGAVSEFEKANLVGKLKSARDRKSAELGRRIEGPKLCPKQIAAAQRLAPGRSLRQVAAAMAEAGFLTSVGTVLSPAHISRLVKAPAPPAIEA